jgi:hypothetical protein
MSSEFVFAAACLSLRSLYASRCASQEGYNTAGRGMVKKHLKDRDIRTGKSSRRWQRASARAPSPFISPARLHSSLNSDRRKTNHSQLYIVVLMTQLAEFSVGDVVLEAWTGSGYETAVLAETRHTSIKSRTSPRSQRRRGAASLS